MSSTTVIFERARRRRLQNEVGGIHHVIKLQKRDEKGVYKDVELFRNYEWPSVLTLFRNIEDQAKSLSVAG